MGAQASPARFSFFYKPKPPSTVITCPVINVLPISNATMRAMSSGCPIRPAGVD